MPLQLPVLDDRTYEQLLEEAKRRIPAHTPEWTNFNVESDPGITLVQLFAFLTDNLLYRANRIPERNRLKFLQLLGIPLQPAAAAEGIVTINNERGPLQAVLLEKGIVLAAGSVNFLTRDPLTALPVTAQVYYKRKIDEDDPRHAEYKLKYEAVQAAAEAANTNDDTSVTLTFYETVPLTTPTASNPDPVLNLADETLLDRSLYVALLAPKNVDPKDVREVLANKTLSIGVVPALSDTVPPIEPARRTGRREPVPDLVYEIADVRQGETEARYARLPVVQQPDVLNEVGVVKVALPREPELLQTWTFAEPMDEGTGDFPPSVEDEQVSARIVTWLRLRLPDESDEGEGEGTQPETQQARLSWVGINAARVIQAVPVSNELVDTGNGEPDQVVTVANTPVLPESLRVEIEDDDGTWHPWQPVADLMAAAMDDQVYTLDPEAGEIRFGTGLNGARPPAGWRIRASYEYGGGPQGNVAIGAVNKSPDVRLQGGFKIANPIPTWGGDEGETVAEGERNIPRHLRHRDRLVTEQDFHDVTWRTPGVDVGRVEVLPLYHPTESDDPAGGVVTVMVIPRYGAVRPLWPTPDRLFLRKVCDHLAPRRLITTELHVRGPEYVSVHLSVGVQIREGHARDQVLADVRARLEAYLSALPPGGPDEEGWPLNRQLMKEDLKATVTRVGGVEFVKKMEMGVETDIPTDEWDLADLQLPLLATLAVREGDAEPLATILEGDGGDGPPAVQVVPVPVTKGTC